nr:protein trichome birefringence-like 2 [Tanacetum cinerariifolium]
MYILYASTGKSQNPISNNTFVFKGFSVDNSSSTNKSALISWSLSFTRNPAVNSSSNGKLGDLGDAHFGNYTNNVKNGSLNGVYDKKSDFEGTHLSNVTNDVKNVSFDANSAKSDNSESTLLSNVTNDVKNSSFGVISDNSLDGKVLTGGKDANVSDANAGLMLGNFSSSYTECDIFDGRWVRDDTKPYYPAGSCPYIDRDFDCHLNKRPDDGYVKWKWQPFGCDIPSLNATDFLERLRGKKLVFIGDSLNRNMWESLVCILRASVPNKKRVYEISGRHEFKKKGFYAFRFE